ncbi:hypothetical protein SAMD00023353_0702610 [Rosellinia necatrix]|uniref:Uncharacterized protein n=1 Tax=Rosellinia necatrix TaxID=77044 RepID=A0A1S7UM71_ROSNE|nr:hypothetical protein SAMD00023353_0702610 [Rosellinia necatrix]
MASSTKGKEKATASNTQLLTPESKKTSRTEGPRPPPDAPKDGQPNPPSTSSPLLPKSTGRPSVLGPPPFPELEAFPATVEASPATVPRPPKRPAEYALRMNHGWTVSDGTFDPIPQDKRRKRDVPYPSFVNHTYRSMSGLSSLQLSRDAPVSLCAMDIACDHLWKCMPAAARRYLHVAPPNGPALWSADDEVRNAMYKKMDDRVYQVPTGKGADGSEYRFYSELKKRPWIIWPLWVEDEWGSDYVTVIWHSRATAQQRSLFDKLVAYAIIDPRRSPDPDNDQRHPPIKGRQDRIEKRLLEFWGKAGFDVQNAKALDVLCSPMPLNEATSGERCFAAVKALIKQLIDWYTSGMKYDHNTTLKSMSQWVNPFQERIEMTGINAWILMAALDYNARISVEAILPNTRVEVSSNGRKKYLYPYDLAGPYDEPPIAPRDYFLPPTPKKPKYFGGLIKQ